MAATLKIKRIITPQPGQKSAAPMQHERQRWFRRPRRFQTGFQGRIIVFERKHSFQHWRIWGQKDFACWVGWMAIANILTKLGQGLAAAA